MRHVEVDTYHEATATHLLDVRLLGLKFLQFGYKIFACLMRIVYKMLALHNIEHGKSCCTRQMVTAKCCSELSVFGFEVGRDKYGTHGEAVAYAFGHGDKIGTYAEPLMSKELARTAVTTLYLVAYQHSTVFLACCLKSLGKLLSGELYAAHTLYALNDAGADIALSQFALPCLKVVKRQISYVIVGIDGRDNLRMSVASTASEVRPWNAFEADSTRVRPVLNEASFSAFSLASAPLLIRNS